MIRSRRLWIWVHKWLCLTLGAALALVGLTGSAIVFYREIDAALNPALYAAAPAVQPRAASDILRIAGTVAPGPVTSLRAPDPIWPAWTALHRRDGHLWTTHIAPDGAVLGSRNFDASLAFTLYKLHYSLLLKPWWGMEMVGVLGLALLASAGSGLYLWWPRTRFWRALVTVRSRPRQTLYQDLHNLAGAWTAVILLVVAFTGVAVVFPGLVRPLVSLASPATPYPRPVLPNRDAPYAVDADRAIAIALARVPGAALSALQPPRASQAWRVRLRWPDASSAYTIAAQLWVDPWTGAVVEERSPAAMSAGDRFMAAQLWLHNGSLMGWPGRILVFLSGLALPVLFATGVLLWLRKRRVRRALDRLRQTALFTSDPGPATGQGPRRLLARIGNGSS